MNRIKVQSGEYKIVDMKDSQSLYTMNLDRDIAFTLYSGTSKKVVLARNLNDQQCVQLFKEVENSSLVNDCIMELSMIVGDGFAKRTQYLDHLIRILVAIATDNVRVNSIGYDLEDRIHPNSFEIHCLDGRLYEI
jgi:hypothetical protein